MKLKSSIYLLVCFIYCPVTFFFVLHLLYLLSSSQKFREYLLGTSRIARLDSKHEHIRQTLVSSGETNENMPSVNLNMSLSTNQNVCLQISSALLIFLVLFKFFTYLRMIYGFIGSTKQHKAYS